MKIRATLFAFGLLAALPVWAQQPGAARKAPAPPAQREDPAVLDSLRKQADRLYSDGRLEDARALYVRLAPSYPQDFALHKRLGDLFISGSRRDLQQAARYYARAHALQPDDEDVELNLARAHSWSGQHKEAISILERIVARERYHRDALIELARVRGSAGDLAGSIAAYRSFLQRFPADREARLEFASVLTWNKQYAPAIEEYRYILNADRQNVKAKLGLAQLLSWQGQLEESLKLFEEVLAVLPRHGDARRGRAFVLLWLQRHEEAERIFQQLAKEFPGDKEIQDALRQIAAWKADESVRRARAEMDALVRPVDEAIARNDLAQAIEFLKKAVAQKPAEKSLRFRLGQVYGWHQQWTEAIAVLRALSTEYPDDLDIVRELGNAQVGAKQFAEAIQTYRTYLQRSPNAEIRLALARVLSWSSRLEEATATYEQLLAADPANFEAGVGLAQVLSWRGQGEEALRRYDALLKLRPGNRDALLGKAHVLHWTGRSAESQAMLEGMSQTWPQDREVATALQSVRDAERQRIAQQQAPRAPVDIDERIRMYRETIARDPQSVTALERLGELYEQKADYREALSFYQRTLDLRPGDKNLRATVARLATWTGDSPRAIEIYQRLLAEEPSNRLFRLELAKLLSWSGRNPESIDQYREILRWEPDNMDARLGLARVLSWNKQLGESLAEYSAILQAHPDNRDAQIERARVLSWKGEFSAALRTYDGILIQKPTDRDARLGKAQALQWSGRPREARSILEEMQAENPKDPDITLAMASTQRALGRRDLALRQLDELEKIQPANPELDRMRRGIHDDLRPVLVMGFTPSVDSFDLKIFHASSTIYFSPSPQVRSWVTTNFIPSDDPVFGSETGREFLFGSSGRATDWLLLRGEIGGNAPTSGPSGAIGSAGATVFAHEKVQFDLDVSRRYLNYLPRTVQTGISRVELRAGWDWRPDRLTTFHLDYFHQRYSDTNRNNGGNFTVRRALVQHESLTLETGYIFSLHGFDKDIASGYFAPSRFRRHAGLLNLRGKVHPKIGYSFWGSVGGEQIAHDPYRPDGTARGSWDFSLTERLKFSLGYGYFAISSIARSGGYRTHVGQVTLEYRF